MTLHIYDHIPEMSEAAAEWITHYLEQRLQEKKKVSILLSGGNTPKELYNLLATEPYSSRIDWQKIHIFFGDERFVPFSDDLNNGRMAYEILLKHVPVPLSHIHFISTENNRNDSAEQYEKLLQEHFKEGENNFDLALLGIGNDGHTLSLFPGNSEIHEEKRWVFPSQAPTAPVQRISLSAEVVNRSECIVFLVTGKSKAEVLEQIIHGEYNPDLYPAQLIRKYPDNIHWFADHAAMEQVEKNMQ